MCLISSNQQHSRSGVRGQRVAFHEQKRLAKTPQPRKFFVAENILVGQSKLLGLDTPPGPLVGEFAGDDHVVARWVCFVGAPLKRYLSHSGVFCKLIPSLKLE